MKKGISPAVAAIVVLVVLVVAIAAGYFLFMRPKAVEKVSDQEAQESMDRSIEHMQQIKPPPPGRGGPARGR